MLFVIVYPRQMRERLKLIDNWNCNILSVNFHVYANNILHFTNCGKFFLLIHHAQAVLLGSKGKIKFFTPDHVFVEPLPVEYDV